MITAGPHFAREQLAVVTPELVEIRLTPAGLGSRFLALVVDVAIVLGTTGAIFTSLRSVLPLGIAEAIVVTINFILTWGYHVYFESRGGGRSPGKRMFGLRVVDSRGLPVTMQQSMVRNVVRVLDSAPLLYGLGGSVVLLERHHRRLGDILADTLVIEEEAAGPKSASLGTTRHFNSLRKPKTLHRIRHDIGLEEREFLLTLCLRSDELEAAARYDLMEEVGAHYRDKLGVDDAHLSGENLVRDLTSLLFSERLSTRRAR